MWIWAYRFLDSKPLMASSKKTNYGSIKVFFLANRCPLPQDRHRFRSDKAPVVGELTVEEFHKILSACRLDYRCAFMMMFQSGSGCAELCHINEVHADHVFDEVKWGADIIRLPMRGRKQKRNVQPYYTFVGRDTVDCLRQLFHSRGWKRDTVLFRTEKGRPFSRQSLHRYLQSRAFKLGFIKPFTPKCFS